MDKKITPGVIAIAAIALIAVLFFLYRSSLGGGQGTTSADNAPEYVKRMQKGQNPGQPFK